MNFHRKHSIDFFCSYFFWIYYLIGLSLQIYSRFIDERLFYYALIFYAFAVAHVLYGTHNAICNIRFAAGELKGFLRGLKIVEEYTDKKLFPEDFDELL